jgi:hypothetical protein
MEQSEMFDDGFDAEDALMIGGAMGLAEEAIRDENEALSQEHEVHHEASRLARLKDVNLQIFRNTNPELFEYIVAIVIRQKRKWRKQIAAMRNSEVNHELRALEKTEELLDDV